MSCCASTCSISTPTGLTDHSASARPQATPHQVPLRPSSYSDEIGSAAFYTSTSRSHDVTGFSAPTGRVRRRAAPDRPAVPRGQPDQAGARAWLTLLIAVTRATRGLRRVAAGVHHRAARAAATPAPGVGNRGVPQPRKADQAPWPSFGTRQAYPNSQLLSAIKPGQYGLKLSSGGNAEFCVDLPEMPLDGAAAEEELCADLTVGLPVPGQPSDVLLL